MNKYVRLHILEASKYNRKSYFKIKVTIVFLLLCGLVLLSSCSNKPIVDSRGKSSANIKGDMNRFHDDLYTCRDLVKDETNFVLEQGKIVYNLLRFKVLWLSPKAQTRQDLINNCLEGRGYNVLNK
jgi:hypothetical protein